MSILIKIHRSLRIVVAVCDSELLGKRFEEDIRQLELREHFFKGEEYSQEDAEKLMHDQMIEDATFNIVGEKSVQTALKAGVITEEVIAKIQNVPFALKLL